MLVQNLSISHIAPAHSNKKMKIKMKQRVKRKNKKSLIYPFKKVLLIIFEYVNM